MSFGLPSLPASVTIFDQAFEVVSDLVSFFLGGQTSEWGIFLDGVPVILADNVLTMGYSKDNRVAEYPQEQGAFASYNKVTKPFDVKLRFSTGGSIADRADFIDSIDAIVDDTLLYEIVTPEKTYTSVNIVHSSYDRDAQVAGLLSIDVWVKQIRIAGAVTFSNTKSPGGAAQVSNGLVQKGPDLPDLSTPFSPK